MDGCFIQGRSALGAVPGQGARNRKARPAGYWGKVPQARQFAQLSHPSPLVVMPRNLPGQANGTNPGTHL